MAIRGIRTLCGIGVLHCDVRRLAEADTNRPAAAHRHYEPVFMCSDTVDNLRICEN